MSIQLQNTEQLEDNNVIEDKRKGKAQALQKRHMSQVNLLLWHKIMAVYWPLAFSPGSGLVSWKAYNRT